MDKTPWIIANDATRDEAYMLKCLRCGATQSFNLPISIDYYVGVGKVFQKEHRRCKEEASYV